MARINHLIQAFGLTNQANTIVGTPIRKGLSGGQKRRLGVASQLITGPRMVFLDEPTSGLDSAASYEVMSFISKLAKENQLIVILSIHQPSTSTFYLFDRLLLLSAGRTQYFGSVEDATTHYAAAGNPVPRHCNPAEYYLQLLNQDFTSDQMVAQQRLGRLNEIWASSTGASHLKQMIDNIMARREDNISLETRVSGAAGRAKNPAIVAALVHRSFIKSYRDLITYGVRLAMYSGLAIMMGTVWLRLDDNQSSIQPFINCIFFGSAFMSFMAVAYIPSFLEDRSTFIKERANGLYGAAAFHIANFILGLPYLFLFSVTFSILAYWLVALQPTAQAFFTWIMWIFLDLVAAESLVVLVSSIFPNFVVALALVAFANGLWMSVGGFMVTPKVLNVFWKYVFHYIDYQTYVFQGMMVNEFKDRTYVCQQTPSGCSCMYESPLASQCKIAGQGVLAEYEYPTNQMGLWVGIMIGIIAGYRLLGWAVLAMKKH
jgi:energy-coupling factor transporter ATP-binding protein EcfA2/ABC-type multidrug transport system permease subunit